ncbi:MAG: Eco57I restriction-modification methylase domain-containing protein, partial [Candidatus Binatia bacterium]
PWVVDLLLDLAGYTPAIDLGAMVAVEPAAGDGRFLIAMVERLLASCQNHGRSLISCAPALLSYELDPEANNVSRDALLRVLRGHGVAEEEGEALVNAWIRTGDYLLDAPSLPPADFVIGNPPYVRLEDMDVATADLYRRRYRTMVGRADLYIAFFEAALKQLKRGGVCAYICADRWMLNQYGAELRRLITASYGVETLIEMHRADAFALDVSAYPAITVIRRGSQGEAVVARADTDIAANGSASIGRVLMQARTGTSTLSRIPGLQAARVDSWFHGADPWPCTSPERLTLLKHLEAEFYPLESAGTGTKVGIGVATGADDVFITTDPDVAEPSRLLPLAMASDTRGGELAWSGNYLVNPWNDRGIVDLSAYPKLRSHFLAHEQRLRDRHVGKRNPAGWYRTIDRVDHRLTNKTKLYISDIKDRLNPVLDRGETYPHHNLYFVQSAVWDPEVLGGLLLSDVAQFFVECYGVRMRGGYLRFQAQYLRRIRVPRPHDVTPNQAESLRHAFRQRSRVLATEAALDVYGIVQLPRMEDAP